MHGRIYGSSLTNFTKPLIFYHLERLYLPRILYELPRSSLFLATYIFYDITMAAFGHAHIAETGRYRSLILYLDSVWLTEAWQSASSVLESKSYLAHAVF